MNNQYRVTVFMFYTPHGIRIIPKAAMSVETY